MNIRFLSYIIVFCLSATMLSCGGSDDDDSNAGSGTTQGSSTSGGGTSGGTHDDGETGGGSKPATLSVDARPTDWVRVGSDHDYVPGVSLSLVIAAPILSQYVSPSMPADSEGDLMAVFVNGTCRGVSGLFTADEVFMPSVVSLEGVDNPDESKPVTIRYYSARLHHVFTARQKYYLRNGVESYGTRTAPVVLQWE